MTRQQTDIAAFINNEIKSFTQKDPANRMPAPDRDIIFDEPLVQFADGADPIFTEYKTIIAPTHLTPREALAQAYNKNPGDMPSRLSVISWILPIAEKTRKSNRSQTRACSRSWSHTRWFGEIFNDTLRKHMVELLTGMGYPAAAPGLPQSIKMFSNEKGF